MCLFYKVDTTELCGMRSPNMQHFPDDISVSFQVLTKCKSMHLLFHCLYKSTWYYPVDLISFGTDVITFGISILTQDRSINLVPCAGFKEVSILPFKMAAMILGMVSRVETEFRIV